MYTRISIVLLVCFISVKTCESVGYDNNNNRDYSQSQRPWICSRDTWGNHGADQEGHYQSADADDDDVICESCERVVREGWWEIDALWTEYRDFIVHKCNGSEEDRAASQHDYGREGEGGEATRVQVALLVLWRHVKELQSSASTAEGRLSAYGNQLTALQLRVDERAVNVIEGNVTTIQENFVRQAKAANRSNNVYIKGNTDAHPEHENLIKQEASDGKSNKVSLHGHDENKSGKNGTEDAIDNLRHQIHKLTDRVDHLEDLYTALMTSLQLEKHSHDSTHGDDNL